MELDDVMNSFYGYISWKYVRAHRGNYGNRQADRLAKEAARSGHGHDEDVGVRDSPDESDVKGLNDEQIQKMLEHFSGSFNYLGKLIVQSGGRGSIEVLKIDVCC